jgi:hypothetical protein
MSAATLPPPPPPVCLLRAYVSRGVKGGTVIAEDVLDLDSHQERLLDPDSYRTCVSPCLACGSEVVHAHAFRQRILRPAVPGKPTLVETVRLFRCAAEGCGAVFMVLPAVIARHLWRLWKTVEEVCAGRKTAPRSTRRRWSARLGMSALHLVQVLLAWAATLLKPPPASLLSQALTRRDLLDRLSAGGAIPSSHPFPALAGWVHRAQAGLRLM